MGSLLNSLVVLSLLFGFITTATIAARPTSIGRYGLSSKAPAPPTNDDGNESEETFPEIPRPQGLNGLFDRFRFGFLFGKQKPAQENDEGPSPKNGQNPGPSTESLGSWMVHSENAGVSAMHIQLMPNNKAVWYDSTGNGISEIELKPSSCKPRVGGRETDPQQDCTAHAIEYDVETAEIRTLK